MEFFVGFGLVFLFVEYYILVVEDGSVCKIFGGGLFVDVYGSIVLLECFSGYVLIVEDIVGIDVCVGYINIFGVIGG